MIPILERKSLSIVAAILLTQTRARLLTWLQNVNTTFPIDRLGLLQKQKKARSTSQPYFRCENTHATIGAYQILLALQKLASNSNYANFKYNFNSISKFPKSVTTATPIFKEKSEKKWIVWRALPNQSENSQPTHRKDRIHKFHSLMRGDALQIFKNISSPNGENLAQMLTVFRKKYVKRQSMATAKHKLHGLVVNLANQQLIVYSGWDRDTSKKRIWSCCPCDSWTNHTC